MEPDRVEMSVGIGTVNGDHLVNGVAANGTSTNSKIQPVASSASRSEYAGVLPYTNGAVVSTQKEGDDSLQAVGSILKDAPLELQQVLSSEFYLPMATLINRSAQACWNDMSTLVERLAAVAVPSQSAPNGSLSINDQSKVNLEKKDMILNFAKEHKDVFIKLLVLLQWSRRSEEVRKTIELNLWLQQRRQAFNNATGMLGAMIRGLADAQVPNPDLYTASEVLSSGGVSTMPRLGYIPQPPLTSRQVLRILKRLDTILCTRMAMAEDVPNQLRDYHVHDGRVTFTVPDEFSFDISVASEEPHAKFGMVDFAFLFSPSPAIPDRFHDEITFIANMALDKDGFTGVYDFLHDLTLSYKLSELAKQAKRLSQGLWNGHLRIEVLRRTLVVQYWLKSSVAKSWLEIGIHSCRKQDTQAGTPDVPELRLRWLREGKLTGSEDIRINLAQLSIEDILRQAIAQHTNCLFDVMYDKLSALPLYDSAELEVNQTSSLDDPAACTIQAQLSKPNTLTVSMEPMGGSLTLSPVDERINRLQFDLARSKNIAEEFVSRIAGLRSSTAESNLVKSLPNSRWQLLEGIDISLAEAEKVFGRHISRVSCMRLPNWIPNWMVTITQTAAGDVWWLIENVRPNSITGARATKIVDSHPLYLNGSPSPSYLERLAEWVTGVIALHCNVQFLRKSGLRWRLPEVPAFDGESRLPGLRLTRALTSTPVQSQVDHVTPARKRSTLTPEGASMVHLTYHGTDRASHKVIMVAKCPLIADPIVLKDLASSELDKSIAIQPEQQQLMVRTECDTGTPVVESLLSKISHVENIVACAAAVKKSTEHTLQSLSLSSIAILYHKQPDLSLRITFGPESSEFSALFLPAETNPHRHLSQWVIKSMKRRGHYSSQNLTNIFVVLRMTQPIMSYLNRLQSPIGVDATDGLSPGNHIRIHVLHRQPTAYGLQYFSDSSNFTRDKIDSGTPKKLLARFEILGVKRGDRLMWMVRPAIEEFNTYNRPSYTAKALRDRLDQEIFKKRSNLWLALDGGAACPSDKPEQLLSAIHDTIVSWVKDAVKPEIGGEQDTSTADAPNSNSANDKKAARPQASASLLPPQQQQKAHNQQQRPNGVSRPPQTGNQQRMQHLNGKNQIPKSEVIELDD